MAARDRLVLQNVKNPLNLTLEYSHFLVSQAFPFLYISFMYLLYLQLGGKRINVPKLPFQANSSLCLQVISFLFTTLFQGYFHFHCHNLMPFVTRANGLKFHGFEWCVLHDACHYRMIETNAGIEPACKAEILPAAVPSHRGECLVSVLFWSGTVVECLIK